MSEITKFPTDAGTIIRKTTWTSNEKLKLNYSETPISLTFDESSGIYYYTYTTTDWEELDVFWDTSHPLTTIQQSEHYVGYKEVYRYQQICTNGAMGWVYVGRNVTLRHLVTIVNKVYFKLGNNTTTTSQDATYYYVNYYLNIIYDINSHEKALKLNGQDYITLYDSDSKYNFTESEYIQAQNFEDLALNLTVDIINHPTTSPLYSIKYFRNYSNSTNQITNVFVADTLQNLLTNPTSVSSFDVKEHTTSSGIHDLTNYNFYITMWIDRSFRYRVIFKTTPSTQTFSQEHGGESATFYTTLNYSTLNGLDTLYYGFQVNNSDLIFISSITIVSGQALNQNLNILESYMIEYNNSYNNLLNLI